MPTLIITPTTDHNPSAVPNAEGQYPIQIVRGSILPALQAVRQNDETPCILEADYGAGFEPFADLQLCPPKIETVNGVPVWVNADGELIPFPTGTGTIEPLPVPAREGTSSANRCLAAWNANFVIQTTYQEFASKYQGGFLDGAITIGVLGVLGLLIPVALPFLVALAAMELLSAIGAVLLMSTYTEEIAEEFRCILYCAASDNGSGVVTFNFAQVSSELDARSDAGIWTAIDILVTMLGADALNQAGAVKAVVSGDCDCADCPIENCYVVSEWQESFTTFLPIDGFCSSTVDECRRIDETGMWCDAADTNSMVWYSTMADAWGTTGTGAKNVVITFSPTDDLIAVGWCTDSTASDAVWLTYANNTLVTIPATKLLIIRVRCSSAHVTKLCAENA